MFRNAQLYRLKEPVAAGLEADLSKRPARPCGPLETSRLGWSDPFGDAPETPVLARALSGGCTLLCCTEHKRILPRGAIKRALADRLAQIKAQEGQFVGARERRRIREELTREMIPNTLQEARRTLLYIDRAAGWIVIDVSSDSLADEVLACLRETLGTLRCTPARTDPDTDPASIMRGWVAGKPPQDFALGDSCELRGTLGDIVRVSGMDLHDDEVQQHLNGHKVVTRLALDWDGRLSFILHSDLSVKQIKLAEELIEELDGDEALQEDPVARLEADFALFALQMRLLIARMDAVFKLVEPSN